MAKLGVVQERLTKAGKLGPVARLMPTMAATTLRKDREPPLVIDGPFAETKEQLLGFFIIDCVSLDEALGIARELGTPIPAAPTRSGRSPCSGPGAAARERSRLDRRRARRRATARAGGPGALFP
jgi:hypothetical protein